MTKKRVYIYSQEFLSSNNGAIAGLLLYIDSIKKIPNIHIVIIYNSKLKKNFKRNILGVKLLGINHLNFFNFKIPIKFNKNINFNKNDILLFNSVYSIGNYFLAREALKKKVKYCIISHGGYLETCYRKKFLKKQITNLVFEKNFLINANYVISHFIQESKDIKNLISKKINTIKIPFSLERYINDDDFDKTKSIIYMGRSDIYTKGIDIFLKSLKHSKHIKNFKVRLYLQKSKLSDTKIIQKECENLKSKLNIDIDVLDAVYGERKSKILKKAKIAIFPSRYEAFGLSLIDCLSYNVICLVSNKHQIAPFLSKTNTAFVLDNKPEIYGAKIDEIYLNKTEMIHNKNNLFCYFREEIVLKRFYKLFFSL